MSLMDTSTRILGKLWTWLLLKPALRALLTACFAIGMGFSIALVNFFGLFFGGGAIDTFIIWSCHVCHLLFLVALAMAAPPPVAAEAAADGEAKVIEMMAETEAVAGEYNNQLKIGSNSGRNGGRGSGNGGSRGSGKNGSRWGGGNVGANSFGNNRGRQRLEQATINQKATEMVVVVAATPAAMTTATAATMTAMTAAAETKAAVAVALAAWEDGSGWCSGIGRGQQWQQGVVREVVADGGKVGTLSCVVAKCCVSHMQSQRRNSTTNSTLNSTLNLPKKNTIFEEV